MSDLSYVYAVARIRVREKALLSNADIASLAAMPDEKAVISALVDRGWGDQDSGQDAARILSAEERKTLELVKELKVDPSVFELLSYPNSYHNLKTGIKESFTSENHEAAFYSDTEPDRETVLEAVREKKYELLPEDMREAAAEANEAILSTGDGQLCDVIVDRACLTAMVEAGKKSKSRLLREYAASTAAVTDIKIAARCVRTGKNRNFLKNALAPCDAFDVAELASAASEGEEALHAFLVRRGFGEAAEALKESPSAFERWCDNRLMATIRPQKVNSISMDPVIAFYLARMNEIRTARIIITAKANGFSEDAIRERVREMYV